MNIGTKVKKVILGESVMMNRFNGSPKMGTKVVGSPKLGRERSKTPPNLAQGQPLTSPKLGRSAKAHSLGNIHANNELSIAEPPPILHHASSGPIPSNSHIHAPRPHKAPVVMDPSENTIPHPLDIKLMSGGPPRAGEMGHSGAVRGQSLGYCTGSDSSRSATPTPQEDKEEMRQRELEEAKARATQMEKTMRWWSDCTANWREKWSKVRAERNKAREEVRQLRLKLEATMKEAIALKRDKHALLLDNDKLKSKIVEPTSAESASVAAVNEQPERDVGVIQLPRDLAPPQGEDFVTQIIQTQAVNTQEVTLCDTMSQTDLHLQIPLPNQTSPRWREDTNTHLGNGSTPVTNGSALGARPSSYSDMNAHRSSLNDSGVGDRSSGYGEGFLDTSRESSSSQGSRERESPNRRSKKDMPSPSEEKAEQRAFMLQMKLDEASKTIQVERQEKDTLHQTINRLEQEVSSLKLRSADLQEARDTALREVQLLKISHQQEIGRINSDLEDEACSRNNTDKRLGALRKELERLQAENASEWGRRERLETEKLNLERENKKQKAEIEDLKETITTRSKQTTQELENTIKIQQEDLKTKTSELNELKHTHSRIKKELSSKTSDLDHTTTRCDQHEDDVKKLRIRVEELKRELARQEDEVDEQSNLVKKLQRNLDETHQQNDNLNLQIEHLQTRLRSQASSVSLAKKRISGLKLNSSNSDADSYSD